MERKTFSKSLIHKPAKKDDVMDTKHNYSMKLSMCGTLALEIGGGKWSKIFNPRSIKEILSNKTSKKSMLEEVNEIYSWYNAPARDNISPSILSHIYSNIEPLVDGTYLKYIQLGNKTSEKIESADITKIIDMLHRTSFYQISKSDVLSSNSSQLKFKDKYLTEDMHEFYKKYFSSQAERDGITRNIHLFFYTAMYIS